MPTVKLSQRPQPATSRYGDLPYGPRLSTMLDGMYGAFGMVNRWFALPLLRAGLGPLFSTPLTGSLMVLRTTGRRTGRRRETPLGYAIVDGAVYCCAGFGRTTSWLRNLDTDPRVEVVLPTAAFSGVAETVTDEAEWDRVFPAYARAMGIVGRLTLGDIDTIDAARRLELRRSLPLVRIRPTGIAAGPADPGGALWVLVQAALLGWLAHLLLSLRRRSDRRAHRT
jgi:deazaflavin-dependent oxidoreductase (nitroreductase family)